MSDDDEVVEIDATSPATQTHLQVIQDVIQRMAANSVACKTWCITIVSAILVLIAQNNRPHLVWLVVLPAILFGVLDAYYLALEKGFRASYDAFVRKLHARQLKASDLYSLRATGDLKKLREEAANSFSVFGFYLGLIAIAALTSYMATR